MCADGACEDALELLADRRAYEDVVTADDGMRYTTDEAMRMVMEAR